MKNKEIFIDIFSDIACPYCYVGEKHLNMAKEKFLKENPEYTIKTKFHSYFINTGVKEGGESYDDFIKRKKNGDESFTIPFKEKGKKVGLNYANWKYWPYTLYCHALMKEAEKENKADKIFEELLAETFDGGKNFSNIDELNVIAEKYGIKNWNTEENREKAQNEFKECKEKYKIKSVPFYIFNKNLKIDGSGTPEDFDDAFDTLVN